MSPWWTGTRGTIQTPLRTPGLGWLLAGHKHPAKQHVRWELHGSQPIPGMGMGGPCSQLTFPEGHQCAAGRGSSLLSPCPHLLLLTSWWDFFCIYFSKWAFHSVPVADNWKLCVLLPWAKLSPPMVLTQALQVWMKVRSYSWVHPRHAVGVLAFGPTGWIKLADNLVKVLNCYGNK